MNKTLVAVFDSEANAFEGLTALKGLHLTGDITLYDSAVVAADASGGTRIVKGPDNPMTGTFLGLFMGTLVGAFAGPIGMAAGAAVGTFAGATSDLIEDSIDYSFVEQVRQALVPGRVAVIADIDETWVTPVNLTLAEHGGIAFRRYRDEIVEDQLAREHHEFEAELKELKKEFATASEEARASLQKRIDMLEKSLRGVQTTAEARIKKITSEWEAKRSAMEQQLARASEHGRARIQNQIAKAKEQYETRKSKLQQAQHLMMEALRP
jgi:uncharacterized membrane protein